MKKALTLLALAASLSSAFAISTTYVYPIASFETLADKTVAFTTTKGLTVYVNCERFTFDDSTHDFVSGFDGKADCENFVKNAKDGAGKGVEIEMNGASLSLRTKF
jgi:hypothetical protein